jgi:hypothetical protein
LKRKDFQELAALRLKEAKILLQAKCWEGAYYLAGYVAKCALKACIAKRTVRHEFPDRKRVIDSHTHDLTVLMTIAELGTAVKEAAHTHPELHANWTIVRNWTGQHRYEKPSQLDAENIIRALEQPKHGLLRWLKQKW